MINDSEEIGVQDFLLHLVLHGMIPTASDYFHKLR